MIGFGSPHHNWVAAPDSAAASDEEEFPAYAEPIERSDTDYYYDFESDQLRGAWPSKPKTDRGRQPPSGRWPSKADPEGPQDAQQYYRQPQQQQIHQQQQQQTQSHYDHYGDYAQSEEDYAQSQEDHPQSSGHYQKSSGHHPQSSGHHPQSQGQDGYEPQRVIASDDRYQMLEHSYESGYQGLGGNQERQDYVADDESSLGSFGSFYSSPDYTTLEATSPTVPPKFEIRKEAASDAVKETAATSTPLASESTALRV